MTPDFPSTPPVIPDYELLKPIGRGSYGDVWLARSVTGVFRVIKIVHRSRFENARPFERELEGISRYQAAASGRPRQLALLHVGRNDAAGYFYYVMEPADDVVDGSAIHPERYVPLTLREMLRRRGRLPAAESIQIALELARGLAILHGEKLTHRDIKPSNIIFVQGVPKLADVGLVAASESTFTTVGTPGYLPPEGGGAPTGDIYSFGKVLYEMITGLDRSEFPRLPDSVTEDPDSALINETNAVVMKACHFDPRERHASADALARDLELIQAGRSVAFYEEVRRRFRAFAIGAGALALLLALAAGSLAWRSSVVERANTRTRLALYRSAIAEAQLAYASGDLGRARTALKGQIPQEGESDLRGLEWAILNHEVYGEGAPLQPVTNTPIRRLAIDPSGRWLAGALDEDRIALWDLETKKVVRVIGNAKVLGGFLPDSRLVVDEPQRRLRLESPLDGQTTVELTNERLQLLLPDGRPIVISPAGDLVLSLLPFAGTGSASYKLNISALWPNCDLSSFACSTNARTLFLPLFRISGAQRERWIAAIDFPTGKVLWQTPAAGRIVWIKASLDGEKILANIGGTSPSLLSTRSPNNPVYLIGHSARVQDAQFSPDGTVIATAGADQTIRLWDSNTGREIRVLRGLGRPATALTWTPDGTAIFGSDDAGNVRLFSLKERLPPSVVSGYFDDVHGDIVFNETGNRIAVSLGTNETTILRASDLQRLTIVSNIFQPISLETAKGSLTGFAADWSVKESAISNGAIRQITQPLSSDFVVLSCEISHQRTRVVLTSKDSRLAIINLESSKPMLLSEPDSNAVWAIAFEPSDESFFTGSASGFIRQRASSSGQIITTIAEMPGEVQALRISPDGRWIAAALYEDSSIRIFDRSRLRWLRPLIAHRRFVQSMAFTPDSRRLISAGTDGRVIFWRVPQFDEIASFDLQNLPTPNGDEGIAVLRMSPSGTALAALAEDGRVWTLRTSNEVATVLLGPQSAIE